MIKKRMMFEHSWNQWRKISFLSENLILDFMLFSIFIISICFLWYRKHNDIKEDVWIFPNTPIVSEVNTTQTVPTSVDLVNNERLTNLENDFKNVEPFLKIPNQLIAFELLHEALEGSIPLKAFFDFLQKHPEDWTIPIMKYLSSIQECKTYLQLQTLLPVVQPSSPKSFWKKLKNKLKSIVSIYKLDKEGKRMETQLEDIHSPLQMHNIQIALEVFNKLPNEVQTQYLEWKEKAQERLKLETIKKNILLMLSEE